MILFWWFVGVFVFATLLLWALSEIGSRHDRWDR